MALTPRIELLKVQAAGLGGLRHRLFREWCLVRAIGRRLSYRVALLLVMVLGGGAAYRWSDSRDSTTFLAATYAAFGLMFGDHPPQLPVPWLLRIIHFLLPVLGLGVVLEGIVEMGSVIRDRRQNERAWSIVMAESLNGHVILVGFGKIGYRIYRTLHRLGIPVIIIDSDDKSEFLPEARRDGAPIIIGDARREALLDEANLASARALVVATNDDLANLEVALDARQKRPDVRVVMRMFDQNMADKVHAGFDIRAVLSTAGLAAPTFAAAAIVENVIASTVVADQLLVTVRTTIGPGDPWCDKTLSELTSMHRLCVLGHAKKDADMTVFPPASLRIGAGDELVVQGLYDELLALSIARP